MANFQDLQNSAAELNTAVTNLQLAITAHQTTDAGAITATQADTIVTAMGAAVQTLNNITTGLTPA